LVRRIAACMFQFVREDADETIIVRRLSAKVRLPLISNEENRLHWSSTPICLDPAFFSLVHCASPNSHLTVPQSRVGQFNYDAANIFVCEEVVPRKLHVIEIAVHVEKEWIAAPTEEKTVVASFRHQGFRPD